jgi:hypothetical protein
MGSYDGGVAVLKASLGDGGGAATPRIQSRVIPDRLPLPRI